MPNPLSNRNKHFTRNYGGILGRPLTPAYYRHDPASIARHLGYQENHFAQSAMNRVGTMAKDFIVSKVDLRVNPNVNIGR